MFFKFWKITYSFDTVIKGERFKEDSRNKTRALDR